MSYQIIDRKDRFGANVLCIIAQLEICKHSKFSYYKSKSFFQKHLRNKLLDTPVYSIKNDFSSVYFH